MPLSLLLKLKWRMLLPIRIVDPLELRYVSVLVATGLIEAQFETFGPNGRNKVARAATVQRITAEGLAELAASIARGELRPPHGLHVPRIIL